MITVKAVQDVGTSPPAMSTGRRIWTMTALIFSVLVLLLAVAGIAGAWVGRSVAVETVTEVMTSVDQLATAGRDGVVQVDTLVTDVREVVGIVQQAADEIAQNMADDALLLNVLPSETVQELEVLAARIRTTLEGILSVLAAAADLIEAVGSLPFVDLPQPQEVGALQREVQGILAGIEQLVADVRQFRQETAAEMATVSATAAEVNSRLETTQNNLATIDSELSALQVAAGELKERFPQWAAVTAVLLNLFLLWVAYAMVYIIRAYWAEWPASRMVGKMAELSEAVDEEG